MKKRISFLLSFIMIFSVMAMPTPISATEPVNTYADTKNSEQVMISTAADYKAFFADITANEPFSFSNKTVVLQNDIVFNETENIAEWGTNPPECRFEAGEDTSAVLSSNGFDGVFDGNGYCLVGVYVNISYTARRASGLFPMTKNATVKNLKLDGFYICNDLSGVSGSYISSEGIYGTGALIGLANGDTTVDNVVIKNGTIINIETRDDKPTTYVGGVIGVFLSYTRQIDLPSTLRITNTTVKNVNIEEDSGSEVVKGGIIGARYYQGEGAIDGLSTVDLTGSVFKPNGAGGIEPINMSGADINGRADAYKIINTAKAYCAEIAEQENGGEALEALRTAINEAGVYGEDTTVANVRMIGAQNKTDGGEGIRFVGALMNYSSPSDINRLGFRITVAVPSTETEEAASNTSAVSVRKVYEEVMGVVPPEGYEDGYIFTLAIVGDGDAGRYATIPEGTSFTVSAFVTDETNTYTATTYTYVYSEE